jgi:hypothetical protein
MRAARVINEDVDVFAGHLDERITLFEAEATDSAYLSFFFHVRPPRSPPSSIAVTPTILLFAVAAVTLVNLLRSSKPPGTYLVGSLHARRTGLLLGIAATDHAALFVAD